MARERFLIVLIMVFCCVSYAGAGEIIEMSQEGYCLSIPHTSRSEKRMPVLICLPGWGVKAKNDINMWAFPANKNGFFLIELDIDYTSAHTDSDARLAYDRIQTIIAANASRYNIDQKKIFIAGTSAGGMIAVSLSLMHPDKFVAVGGVSAGRLGFGAEKLITNADNKDYCFFHGQQDMSIPIGEFYQTIEALKRHGAKVRFKVVSAGGHTLPSSCYRELLDWFKQF